MRNHGSKITVQIFPIIRGWSKGRKDYVGAGKAAFLVGRADERRREPRGSGGLTCTPRNEAHRATNRDSIFLQVQHTPGIGMRSITDDLRRKVFSFLLVGLGRSIRKGALATGCIAE